MSDERLRCAAAALETVPEGYRTVGAADIVGRERGHSVHEGMLIGWVWGADGRGRAYLDFLSDHRHPGMQAGRYFADGTTEPIATPGSTRAVSDDPVEDAKIEREFFESNRATYAELRARGLLPAEDESTGSQVVNEHLLAGGSSAAGGRADAAAGEAYVSLGGGWDQPLRDELAKPYWSKLLEFITDEHENHVVYPPLAQTFAAFELTPYDEVRVVILGQDPYPNPGEAHGLAFSVPTEASKKPPSLRNIHQVLASDLSETSGRPVAAPDLGSLEGWAEQGVLLLNTALSVRAGSKADRRLHRKWAWEGQGWSTFTDAVISAVDAKTDPVVFILWGKDAQQKAKLIDRDRHAVITSTHPSPLSAWRGFLTSRPFSEANQALTRCGRGTIDWERVGRDT